MDASTDRAGTFGPRPGLVQTAIVVLLCASLAITALKLTLWDPDRPLVDFDVFYLVSEMIWHGDLAGAYRFESFLPRIEAYFGTDTFMPWTYPPPFDLLLAPLALVPYWLAYTLFTGGTLALYLMVVTRLAGRDAWRVLALVFPALIVTIACGQNGMLTGALIGLFCLRLDKDRWSAGLPLGLMCIKPHLAIALAVYVIASGRWTVLFSAALTTVLAAALATVALGVELWPAFLAGAAEAKVFLANGFYPLYRMVSVYAAAFTLGASPALALFLQSALGVAVLALVWISTRSWLGPRQALGMAVFAAVMVSPYAYDYDLPILGVALALLAREISAGTVLEKSLVCILLPAAGIYGVAAQGLIEGAAGYTIDSPEQYPASVGGILVLLLFALVFRILLRQAHGRPEIQGTRTLPQT